jgi:hypothetical protein
MLLLECPLIKPSTGRSFLGLRVAEAATCLHLFSIIQSILTEAFREFAQSHRNLSKNSFITWTRSITFRQKTTKVESTEEWEINGMESVTLHYRADDSTFTHSYFLLSFVQRMRKKSAETEDLLLLAADLFYLLLVNTRTIGICCLVVRVPGYRSRGQG